MQEELNNTFTSLYPSSDLHDPSSSLYNDSSSHYEYTQLDFSSAIPLQSAFYSPPKLSSFLTPSKDIYADRFIPVRNNQYSHHLGAHLYDETALQNPTTQNEKDLNSAKYQLLLRENFQKSSSSSFSRAENLTIPNGKPNQKSSTHKILKFQAPERKDSEIDFSILEHPFASFGKASPVIFSSTNLPVIAEKPYKILDVPLLEDDFYLNPIDWSKSNLLAIALKSSIYLWSGDDGTVKGLNKLSIEGETYTSVNWSPKAENLAAGASNGKVEVWDVVNKKLVREDLESHAGRVSCISWLNPNIFATGSKDTNIFIRDLRIFEKKGTVQKLKGHKQEICSLKWSPTNPQLASGANDGKIFIWNMKRSKPETRINAHTAAVKALTWSPNQTGILLSGGGNNDKTIKLWNTLTARNMASLEVESQVCNLAFSASGNEFVSTHGFPNNEVIVWKFPELTKIKTLEGHKNRVLFLSNAPDGKKIVTGAGPTDGSLRFWEVFQPPQVAKSVTTTQLDPLLAFR